MVYHIDRIEDSTDKEDLQDIFQQAIPFTVDTKSKQPDQGVDRQGKNDIKEYAGNKGKGNSRINSGRSPCPRLSGHCKKHELFNKHDLNKLQRSNYAAGNQV